MAEINFAKVRTGSQEVYMAGDEINQTLTLYNRSEYDISSIWLQDTLSEGITYVDRSVYVDGTAYPDANVVNGFLLPVSVRASSSATITYTIAVSDDPPKEASVYSTVNYTANGVQYEGETSNVYKMKLANGEILATMTSNKTGAIQGETITYQLVIENIGTANQTAVKVVDSLPAEVEFVTGSVKINGEARSTFNPVTGFTAGNLYANEKMTITFDTKVL